MCWSLIRQGRHRLLFVVNLFDPNNTLIFTVDTTNKNDKQLHDAIAAKYEALPITPALNCQVLPPRPTKSVMDIPYSARVSGLRQEG